MISVMLLSKYADFLDHFGLESLDDLPGVSDLRAAGLLDDAPLSLGLGLELPVASEPEEADDSDSDD